MSDTFMYNGMRHMFPLATPPRISLSLVMERKIRIPKRKVRTIPFKVWEYILVRNTRTEEWKLASFYEYNKDPYDKEAYGICFSILDTEAKEFYRYALPYEGYEDFLGTRRCWKKKK